MVAQQHSHARIVVRQRQPGIRLARRGPRDEKREQRERVVRAGRDGPIFRLAVMKHPVEGLDEVGHDRNYSVYIRVLQQVVSEVALNAQDVGRHDVARLSEQMLFVLLGADDDPAFIEGKDAPYRIDVLVDLGVLAIQRRSGLAVPDLGAYPRNEPDDDDQARLPPVLPRVRVRA